VARTRGGCRRSSSKTHPHHELESRTKTPCSQPRPFEQNLTRQNPAWQILSLAEIWPGFEHRTKSRDFPGRPSPGFHRLQLKHRALIPHNHVCCSVANVACDAAARGSLRIHETWCPRTRWYPRTVLENRLYHRLNCVETHGALFDGIVIICRNRRGCRAWIGLRRQPFFNLRPGHGKRGIIKKAPLDAGPKSREETPSRSRLHRIPNRSLDGCKITTHRRKFDTLKTKSLSERRRDAADFELSRNIAHSPSAAGRTTLHGRVKALPARGSRFHFNPG
jgi:hypothetical protein